jgi:hypothetical protein
MRQREKEREVVKNILESNNLVLIDEDGHTIIMIKFTQRKYPLVNMTGFHWLSIRVQAGFYVKSVTL